MNSISESNCSGDSRISGSSAARPDGKTVNILQRFKPRDMRYSFNSGSEAKFLLFNSGSEAKFLLLAHVTTSNIMSSTSVNIRTPAVAFLKLPGTPRIQSWSASNPSTLIVALWIPAFNRESKRLRSSSMPFVTIPHGKPMS